MDKFDKALLRFLDDMIEAETEPTVMQWASVVACVFYNLGMGLEQAADMAHRVVTDIVEHMETCPVATERRQGAM